MPDILDGLVLLPRLRVENANAISGPLTWGFPAPSAFTGFVHALQRKIGDDEIKLDGVGIVCHRFDPQIYHAEKFRRRFCLARHPVGIDGKPQGLIEEGRAHIEVSLLIGVYGRLDEVEGQMFAKRVQQVAMGMRLAGGSLLPAQSEQRHKARHIELSGSLAGDKKVFRKLRRLLLPGFALVNRHDLLREHLAELREQHPETSALDALLDLIQLNIEPMTDDPRQPDKATWRAYRSRPGWLTPLPVGYGAISPLHPPGTVKNTRDNTTPFRFVESLYSLGEWLSPHRLEHPQQLLWYHQFDSKAGVYLCNHIKTSA